MPIYQIRLKNQLGLTILFRAKPALSSQTAPLARLVAHDRLAFRPLPRWSASEPASPFLEQQGRGLCFACHDDENPARETHLLQ